MAVKQPTDRLPKKIREYVPAEYVIDGERYPDVVSKGIKFAHYEMIEDATGKEFSEVSPVMRFGLTVWLAVSAVVPTVTWEHFKNSTDIDAVTMLDPDGLTTEEWIEKYPADAKALAGRELAPKD